MKLCMISRRYQRNQGTYGLVQALVQSVATEVVQNKQVYSVVHHLWKLFEISQKFCLFANLFANSQRYVYKAKVQSLDG